MFIRTQDKETLVDVNVFNIYQNIIGKYAIYGSNTSNSNEDFYFNLGCYKKHEKALKVLDMIQQKIIEIDKTKFYGVEETTYRDNVFQMPKDEEVT